MSLTGTAIPTLGAASRPVGLAVTLALGLKMVQIMTLTSGSARQETFMDAVSRSGIVLRARVAA